MRLPNLFSAVALKIARVCNCPDARTQLAEIIGTALSSGQNGDAQIWRDKFSSVVRLDKLDKLRMPKINMQTGLVKWLFFFPLLQQLANRSFSPPTSLGYSKATKRPWSDTCA